MLLLDLKILNHCLFHLCLCCILFMAVVCCLFLLLTVHLSSVMSELYIVMVVVFAMASKWVKINK